MRRDLGDDAVGEDLAVPRVMDVHGVVIEGRHRGHHRRHHGHRVRVVVEAVEEAQQRLVDHRVITDVVGELLELLAARQVAVQQQVRHFHEAALLGQLLDGIAAMQQHAGVAVDVGDAAFGGCGGAVAGIVGEDAEILVERRDIHAPRADGAAAHRQTRSSCRKTDPEAEFGCRLMRAREGYMATRRKQVATALLHHLDGLLRAAAFLWDKGRSAARALPSDISRPGRSWRSCSSLVFPWPARP